MSAALSGPSITSNAASFWTLLSRAGSAAAAFGVSIGAGIGVSFGRTPPIHPVANRLGHVRRILLDQTVQHIDGHHAGIVARPIRLPMAVAVSVRPMRNQT